MRIVLAKHALSLVDEGDVEVRKVAARLVSSILLDQYTLSVENREKQAEIIAEHVFKDFERPFMRMWIAAELPVIRDTIDQHFQTLDLPVAKALVYKQQETTPDLPELLFVKAQIMLNDGYKEQTYDSDLNVYDSDFASNALKLFDKILEYPPLEKEVVPIMVNVYFSFHDSKSSMDLINHKQFDRYYTKSDLALSMAYYFEFTGQPTLAAGYYRMIGRQDDAARMSFKRFVNPKKYEDSLLKRVRKNPDQSRPNEEYARFLLMQKGEYEKAFEYAIKALKIHDSYPTRRLVGSIYAVRASQVYLKDGMNEKVREYMKLAKSLNVRGWGIMYECGMYCEDLGRLYWAFYREENKQALKEIRARKEPPI